MGEPVEEESLDDFLDKLGTKPNMQDNWDKVSYSETGAYEITQLAPVQVSDTVKQIAANLGVDTFPPPVGELKPGTTTVDKQQKTNIGLIAYALTIQDYKITSEEIYNAWPTEGDSYKLSRAGKRPSINAIQNYLGTDEFALDMADRGVEFSTRPGGLSDEQIALLNILSDTSIKGGLNTRLKRAGVTSSTFKSWKRQRAFSEAFNRLVSLERQDAAEMVDVQLISMAQNGDLNAIKYFNDLVGRGPNDRKAVDSMQFSKIVLEAVMKHVSDPQILKSISAEIELASKQLGA